MGQSKQGLGTTTLETIYTDKKMFTIGSGSGADYRFKGPSVESLHVAVKLDGHNLFIKNLSKSNTQVSSQKVQAEKVIPYKSGEAIRLGDAKPIIFIHLFRKFVAPHEESEAIVREAWEKAKEAEAAALQYSQTLALQQKQAENMKVEAAKAVEQIIKQGNEEADSIRRAAQAAEKEITEKANLQAQKRSQEVEREAERTLLEIKLRSEETTRKMTDQAREQAKELKAEAEREYDTILKSGQREAELLIHNAKRELNEIKSQVEGERQRLEEEKTRIKAEIAAAEKAHTAVLERQNVLRMEMKGLEEKTQQAKMEFEQKKETLRLELTETEKQVELRLSDKRALDSEVSDGEQYLQEMKSRSEAAALKAEAAAVAEKQSKEELAKNQSQIQRTKSEIETLRKELEVTAERLSEVRVKEAQELERLRDKMSSEYEKRKRFEEEWFAKERQKEHEVAAQERINLARLEEDRLVVQAKTITDKILPLISLELETQLSEKEMATMRPKLESVLGPVVQRAVLEEHQFRRSNLHFITAKSTPLQARPSRLRGMGLALVAAILLLAAIYTTFPNLFSTHLLDMSSESPTSTPESPVRGNF
ncbi:MAG: FHA domain-containing protein [Bdellovibrionales bacterium]